MPTPSSKPARITKLRASFPSWLHPKNRSGRSKTWLKTKCFTEGSFVIIGTARDRKTNAPLALLARANAQGLTHAGSAFITLISSQRAELSARLQTSKLERCPIPKLRFPDAHWVKPQLMARVRHLAGAKYLRHGTVRGYSIWVAALIARSAMMSSAASRHHSPVAACQRLQLGQPVSRSP